MLHRHRSKTTSPQKHSSKPQGNNGNTKERPPRFSFACVPSSSLVAIVLVIKSFPVCLLLTFLGVGPIIPFGCPTSFFRFCWLSFDLSHYFLWASIGSLWFCPNHFLIRLLGCQLVPFTCLLLFFGLASIIVIGFQLVPFGVSVVLLWGGVHCFLWVSIV